MSPWRRRLQVAAGVGVLAALLQPNLGLAGLFGGKKPPEAEPTPAAPVAKPQPAEEPKARAKPAPPLFPEGLPVSLQKLPDGLANLSAQGCEGCHYQAHDDWAESAHRVAFSSPSYRRAAEAAGDSPLCVNCHLPLENQQRELVVEYLGGALSSAETSANPSWDATLAQEGVTCAACHVREGVVVGVNAISTAPHPVRASEELTSSTLCASCHQLSWPGAETPFYDTYGEWERSAYAEAGVRCQDCHMPPAGGVVTAGRSATHADHRFNAAQGRGLSVLVRLQPESVVRGETLSAEVRVQNTGAGHAVPTGSPFVQLELVAQVIDREGELVGEPWTHRFGREVDPEPPFAITADTRLPAGGEITLPVTIELPQKGKGGAGAFQVLLRRVDASGAPSDAFDVQHIPLTVY